MFKKIIYLGVASLTIFLAMATVCFAFTLLSEKQAFKEVFGMGANIEIETKELAGDTLSAIETRLGGSLVHYQEGSSASKVAGKTAIKFYFAKQNGKRKAVAIIDMQPGKWGPVEFITAMDLNGKVKKVRVMSYQEQRGRPIARRSFLNQYWGKTSKSSLTVGKDIIGISGATVSSNCATFAVKKAIVLYEEVYLKRAS